MSTGTPASSQIIWLEGRVRELEAEVARMANFCIESSERTAAEIELDAISAAIGCNDYLDPPDGGDVPLAEQVRRMRADVAMLRNDLVACQEGNKSYQDSYVKVHNECLSLREQLAEATQSYLKATKNRLDLDRQLAEERARADRCMDDHLDTATQLSRAALNVDTLRDALENILTVWANKDKKRGWVDRFFEARRRAHAALEETKNA